MNRTLRLLLNSLGTLAVVALGVLGARALLADRAQAPEVPREDTGALVQTLVAESVPRTRVLRAAGTVLAAGSVTLQPEVQGRIVERHPALIEGGIVQAGELLVRIDPRDFRLAVADARTALENAETLVEIEAGRAEVARREWERFGEDAPTPLALRDPQRRQAELQVRSARQALERAELQLARTRITAPLTGVVQRASAEVGQVVGPQSALATLVAIDTFWVRVPVPADDLPWLAIPGVSAPEDDGGPVRVRLGADEREGRILRLLGEVDPAGRMARLLVGIDDPLHLERPEGERTPLLLGSWVEVELPARAPRDVVVLPREAIRDGDRVFVATADGTLDIRNVRFAWRDPETVAVADGLRAGERVITSRVPAPVPGMRLRVDTDTVSTGEGHDD